MSADKIWVSLQHRIGMADITLIPFAASLLLIAVGLASCILAWRRNSRWLSLLVCCTLFAVSRLVLYGNPWIWKYYSTTLDARFLDWREYDSIRHERERFVYKLYHGSPRWVAFGSSQVGAIFDATDETGINPASIKAGIKPLYFGGAGPLDLFLYASRIEEFGPGGVILYLSEMDLARKPSLTLLAVAPNQGRRWWDLWQLLRPHREIFAKLDAELGRAFVFDFVPELKYSFLARGLSDRWLGRSVAMNVKDTAAWTPQELFSQHQRQFRKSIQSEGLAPSLALLDWFLQFCSTRHIRVVVVEGQVNDLITTEATRAAHRDVDATLFAWSRREQGGFVYLQRDKLYNFTAQDYSDGYHVKREAAVRFVSHLAEALPK